MKSSKSIKIEIGHRTIIFAILFIIGIYFIQAVSSILIALFIAYLISTALYPLVKNLSKLKIPRALSAAVILILILISLIASFASILPPVIEQTGNFIQSLPNIIDRLGVYNIDPSLITSQLAPLSGNILKIALDTFSVSIFLVTIFVISFYLIMERGNLNKHLRVLFGDQADKIKQVVVQIEFQLGHWVRTMIFLMFLIGIQTYIGFKLIGLEYALPLAIIAGILEIIPNIGPTVATIPAMIVGFAMSPVHGVLVLVLSILIQQLENNLLVPHLMKKAIGLHPVVTIIALLIGFELGGALLAVLSLPIVLVGKILLTHFYQEKNNPSPTSN